MPSGRFARANAPGAAASMTPNTMAKLRPAMTYAASAPASTSPVTRRLLRTTPSDRNVA